MNLKRVLFTAMAAMCALTSVFATANAQTTGTQDNDSTVTVVLTETGAFSVEICAANYSLTGGPTVTSSTGGTAYGHIGICYTDTKSFRPEFTVSLLASDFLNSGTGTTIPASNFTPVYVYNPHQGQWGWTDPNQTNPAGTCVHNGSNKPGSNDYDIGDIGGLLGLGGYAPGNYTTGHPGKPWLGTGGLATNVKVGYAWEGVGTSDGTLMPCDSSFPIPADAGDNPNLGHQVEGSVNGGSTSSFVNGTYAGMDVQLTVPPGAPAGTYVSTLTLSLTLETP